MVGRNGYVHLLEEVGDLHTDGYADTQHLGDVTADGEPLLNHGLIVADCQTDVVNGLGVVNDDTLGDGQVTGLNEATRGGVDQVDLVTHGVDVGHVLDAHALCQHLTVGESEMERTVVLDAEQTFGDVGVFHDGAHAEDDVVQLLAAQSQVGVHKGLALHGVDHQDCGTVGQLTEGREACATGADHAVLLQDRFQFKLRHEMIPLSIYDFAGEINFGSYR